MAGGRKIDDHSSWMGSKSKGSVFPMGAKVKEMKEGDGCGELMSYEDKAENVKAFQDLSVSKAKSLPMKPNFRQ